MSAEPGRGDTRLCEQLEGRISGVEIRWARTGVDCDGSWFYLTVIASREALIDAGLVEAWMIDTLPPCGIRRYGRCSRTEGGPSLNHWTSPSIKRQARGRYNITWYAYASEGTYQWLAGKFGLHAPAPVRSAPRSWPRLVWSEGRPVG